LHQRAAISSDVTAANSARERYDATMQLGLEHLLAPGSRAMVLQPHYDDAALSCGGTAALIAKAGRTDILTVFASELVPEMVGDFAAGKHQRWRLEDPDLVVAIRRAEDARAAAVLGCNVRWLGLPDAIYRGDNYTSDDALFGPLHPDDWDLAAHLALEVRGLPEWSDEAAVFVPLAIGTHADHQLVFETGRILARQGHKVLAYEDAPYVIHSPAGLEPRLLQVGDSLGPPILIPIGQVLETKIEAVGCYASQIPVIFRFTDDYAAALRDFAQERGGQMGPAERFWPVRS
jgi:LmbE family N-acetylglucosaminyl deacetylase